MFFNYRYIYRSASPKYICLVLFYKQLHTGISDFHFMLNLDGENVKYLYITYWLLPITMLLDPVLRIRIILKRIRIQDVKKFVPDPDPG